MTTLSASSRGCSETFDDMYPVVTCKANFDEILIPVRSRAPAAQMTLTTCQWIRSCSRPHLSSPGGAAAHQAGRVPGHR